MTNLWGEDDDVLSDVDYGEHSLSKLSLLVWLLLYVMVASGGLILLLALVPRPE